LDSLRFLNITYQIDVADLPRKFELPSGKPGYLIDYLKERLTKVNRERIYYNSFVDQAIRVPGIDAELALVSSNARVGNQRIKIRDSGYPEGPNPTRWREDYPTFSGKHYRTQYAAKR
jgi:hypothetical protein